MATVSALFLSPGKGSGLSSRGLLAVVLESGDIAVEEELSLL